MTELTGTRNVNSEQHTDLSQSRRSRDSEDKGKIYQWLKEHNPFISNDSQLRSIATGISGELEVSCDKAEEIGHNIQVSLDDTAIKDAKIKRRDRIICLDSKINTVKINDKSVTVNPNMLFTRLSALAGREDNVPSIFEHELTPYPMSLFKDGMMCKPDKASPRTVLLSKEARPPESCQKIIDGGALLHQVHWPPSIIYWDLIEIYVKTVRNKFGDCHIVFDGYSTRSTKDQEHQCRSSVAVKWKDSLSNSSIKELLISKMTEYLVNDGQNVTQCESDADTDIAKVTLKVVIFSANIYLL